MSAAAAKVLVLGTGTSHGVPMIGCECAVCRSDDPRDTRTRPSVYIALPDGTAVLIDTAPDFRMQALRHRLPRVDAVLYTHGHADHVLGLDDLTDVRLEHPLDEPADRGLVVDDEHGGA